MFDWTIMVTIASIIGTVANIYKKQWCFAIWLVTNVTWCIYDLQIGAFWQAVQFAVYACLAVWGLVQWKRKKS